LPDELKQSMVIPLHWANYEIGAVLRPGETMATAQADFSKQHRLRHRSRAGRAVILSASDEEVRLRVTLHIVFDPVPARSGPVPRGKLQRELTVRLAPVESPIFVRKYPRNAAEEVGEPVLGPMVEPYRGEMR